MKTRNESDSFRSKGVTTARFNKLWSFSSDAAAMVEVLMKVFGAVLVAVALSGCVQTSTIPLGSVQPRPPVPWEQVQVFLKETDVHGEFDKIALIKAEGPHGWTSDKGMVDKVRKEAGKLGANGIILEEIKEASSGAKVAAAVFGVPAQRHGSVIAIWYKPTEKH